MWLGSTGRVRRGMGSGPLHFLDTTAGVVLVGRVVRQAGAAKHVGEREQKAW